MVAESPRNYEPGLPGPYQGARGRGRKPSATTSPLLESPARSEVSNSDHPGFQGTIHEKSNFTVPIRPSPGVCSSHSHNAHQQQVLAIMTVETSSSSRFQVSELSQQDSVEQLQSSCRFSADMATTDADNANSAASGLRKNRFSYHDARYNDLARWSGSGLYRDATMPRDSVVGLIDTITASARISFSHSCHVHRIGSAGCLENHCPKDGIHTPREHSFPLHALRRHICSWRNRFLRIAARGARNERLPHDRSFQSSQDRVCRRPLASQVWHCDVHV